MMFWPEQVHAEQVNLDRAARSEPEADRWRNRFARTSIATARGWTFDITETIAGEPIGSSVRVPVTFSLSDGNRRQGVDNTWHAYLPGPRVPAPWLVDTTVANQPMGPLKDGEVRALTSRFKLKNDLVGSLL